MATMLEIKGQARRPRRFDFEDLAALPGQVPDVSQVIPGREGGAITLEALLSAVEPLPDARYITLATADGAFSASVPLEAVREQGLVVYRAGERPLPEDQGGPVRFFIKDIDACATGGVDKCANVKYLARIELSAEPGPDLRPSTPRAHVELHEREKQGH